MSAKKNPTDDHCQVKLMRPEAIEEDRKTIATILHNWLCGILIAFDDLTALSEIAKKEGMWFHVDGAFGHG